MSINKKHFAKDALAGMLATIATQVITILSIPIITHIYQPEDLGVWQICLSTIGILLAFSTLRLESTIVLARTKTLSYNIIKIIQYISLFVIVLTCISIFLFQDQLAKILQLDYLSPVLWVIPIGLSLSILQLILNTILVKQKKFKILAVSKVLGISAITLTAIVPTFFFNPSAYIYVIAGLTGIVAQILLYVTYINFSSIFDNSKNNSLHLLAALKKYKVYPQYMLPFALSQGIVLQTTLILLGSLFSLSSVGSYVLAKKLIEMPVSLITESTKQVLFAHGVAKENRESALKLISILLINIINIFVPIMVFGFFYITDVVNFFLGEGWERVGLFSKWLLLSSMPMLLTAWLGRMFEIYGRQKTAVFLQVLNDFGLLLLLLTFFIIDIKEIEVIKIISIYTGLYNLIWLRVLLKTIKIPTKFYNLLIIRLFLVTFFSALSISIISYYFSFKISILTLSTMIVIISLLQIKLILSKLQKS